MRGDSVGAIDLRGESRSEWLEAIFEGSRDAIFLSDGDGLFVAVNRAACDLTGYSRGELGSLSIPDLHDDADLHAYREFHSRILGGEEILSRAAIRRKDGHKVETEFSNRPVTVAGTAYVHTTARDVSARCRAELVLRESEARFRALVDQAGEGFELYDPDGRILAVNSETCRQTGYTEAELLRLTIFDIAPHLTPERFRADWEARRNAGITTLETVHRRKDGAPFPVEIKVSILRIGDREQSLSLVHDITERRRTEELARKGAEEHRILTENVKDVVWVLDTDTMTYRYVSPAIERLLGYPVDLVLSMPLGQPFHPAVAVRLRESVRTRAAEFVAGGEAPGNFYTDELLQPHRDGSFVWTEVVSGYYRNPESGHVELRGVTRDVAERHRAHEEIRLLNESLEKRVAERTAQLEDANRELESFSYSVSHDLRAPLRAIDGFSKRVADLAGGSLDAESRRMLGIVRQNAVRMGKLIDDLLAFSRTSRVEVQRSAVPAEALVRGAFSEVVQGLPDRERFTLEVADLPAAWGDPVLLRQVWTNLLSNAVKFSAPSASPRIEVSGSREEGEAVYSVRDNGVGFDMAYAPKLFGVFQRLHGVQEFEGTGVGLALVQRIVVRHGGRVWAEAAVGRGATFSFALPERRGAPAGAA